MRLREPGDRRPGRVPAALLAIAALAPPAVIQAQPAGAAAREATFPGAGEPSPPREVVFVIDASAAMRGAPLAQAKAALAAALPRLRPVDSFNVLALGARTRALFPASWPVRPESLERAARWSDRLEAEGGADVRPALAAALAPPDPGYGAPGTRAVREVVVLAGGAIAGEEVADPGYGSLGTRAVREVVVFAGGAVAGETLADPGEAAFPAAPARHAGHDDTERHSTGLRGVALRGAEHPDPSRPGPAGGTVALLFRLGAGLALFAAALAHALRRGLAAPETAR